MSLSEKQKIWIRNNQKKLNTLKTAKEFNVEEKEISDFVNSLSTKSHRSIFLILTILIPIFFFLILEFSLRYFNYGYSHEQWVESNDGQWIIPEGKYLMLNPDIARKYFHVMKNVPEPNIESFDKVKKANAFRVFILGESSAAGFPFEPNGSFSRNLYNSLVQTYPNSKIEVINCGMSAISSYTIRDFTTGILEQKPDLILIYAGHNEYYGALGVGSTESIGNSVFLVNASIALEKYRTFQLIRNLLTDFIGLFSSSGSVPDGTLMERMVKNQLITYKSDVYENGLSQFEENLNRILEQFKEANVPVIIGQLASNLKDQPPFVSDSSSTYPSANSIYKKAVISLKQGNHIKADSLFRYAKDLDVLRFRAPGEINKIIFNLGKRHKLAVLNIDSAFAEASPDKIVGNNLMIDHLHPNLQGYRLIANLFFNKMTDLKYMPGTKPAELTKNIQDSLALNSDNFSRLDSTIAEYKIILLRNNWPFKNSTQIHSILELIKPQSMNDSIALSMLNSEINWTKAHLLAAKWYIDNNDINSFRKEMDVLVYNYPYNIEYTNIVVTILLEKNDFETAFKYVKNSYQIQPSSFNCKWLGIIYSGKGKLDSARFYSNKSLSFDKFDSQVWYTLATTYINEDRIKAIELLDKALILDPNFQNARGLREYLAKQNN